jgi:hypothetical protein
MLRKLPPAIIAVPLLLNTAASSPSFAQTLRIAMTASTSLLPPGSRTMAARGFAFSASRRLTVDQLGFYAAGSDRRTDTRSRHLVEDR